MRLFHIVDRDVWAAAVESGQYRPSSLDTEGFVHLSYAHQVAGTANLLYRDVPNLVVVEIDPAPFDVVVEDSYGSGTAFPHIYGPIPTASALGLHALERDGAGELSFVPGDRA